MTNKPFSKVERNSQLLELIHSDICEINDMLTRGEKRYFITFIDDYCNPFLGPRTKKKKNINI
jgi:hypothetical protein